MKSFLPGRRLGRAMEWVINDKSCKIDKIAIIVTQFYIPVTALAQRWPHLWGIFQSLSSQAKTVTNGHPCL
ncbi:hypothetical protein JWG39_11135 [Desulforhopalus vacuolatus]|uniref:hypothetical protein n=1 Tax=Desulforhopalus vacuolatus TaxID=40414 RepID=UPI0019634009|nr:hypothetical protein [Desulforhopalus vacuolatus]MBM9520365.1 hypothetical protein [Desulforhopalus vacuolatus]